MVGAESLKHLGSYHLTYENTTSYPFSSLKFGGGNKPNYHTKYHKIIEFYAPWNHFESKL